MNRAAAKHLAFHESRASRMAKRAVLAFILIQLPVGALSSYRAWVQIKRLSVTASEPVLHAGTTVRADVASWARTEADATLELVQGSHVETLGTLDLPRNREPVFDPRPRRDSVVVVLSPAQLSRFDAGPARLRATAYGRPQWLRTPPPVVREQEVLIALRPRDPR